MYALAGSLGIPPLFEATTEAQRKRRRLIFGLVLSLLFHAGLLTTLWFHRAELVPPPFVDDSPATVLPLLRPVPPTPTVEEAAPGGGSEAGGRAARPVHQPPIATPPPLVAPFAPSPESPALTPAPTPSLGTDENAHGEGRGVAGSGDGLGTGVGSGVGSGSGVGGPGMGLDGWTPRWIRLPTRSEARWFYPGARGAQIDGWAVIRCDITPTGRAKRCRALAEGAPGFGAAAVNASRYFRITPRRVNGRAVEAELDIRLEFYTD